MLGAGPRLRALADVDDGDGLNDLDDLDDA